MWIPASELGLALGLIQFSAQIGTVITNPICAYLSEYGFAGGWPSVFYVLGSVFLLALIPWWFLVHDSPESHPHISDQERKYIRETVRVSRHANNRVWVPWARIVSSRKIWAIGVTKFCASWGNLFLTSKLPAYLETILHMPITYVRQKKNLKNSISYIC